MHMSSLYLTPMLPFEPRFGLFILNGYYAKATRLSVDSLCECGRSNQTEVERKSYLKHMVQLYQVLKILFLCHKSGKYVNKGRWLGV